MKYGMKVGKICAYEETEVFHEVERRKKRQHTS